MNQQLMLIALFVVGSVIASLVGALYMTERSIKKTGYKPDWSIFSLSLIVWISSLAIFIFLSFPFAKKIFE